MLSKCKRELNVFKFSPQWDGQITQSTHPLSDRSDNYSKCFISPPNESLNPEEQFTVAK